ncbi:TolC family protein [Flavobacterium sp. LHD-85]|uniref:TolC family protein n=1 Tax=Flavobacterium sp. LHD-85 TaxID=3071410 RepID=UPI0027E10DFE|nr:TolC family protein [Flavobacterium sp. LHD-85]MDQ6530974.1 TolC family protein [Flavobacterium sp. LHD-85]
MKIKKQIQTTLCLIILCSVSQIKAQNQILSLEQAKEQALKNNNNIKKTTQNIQAAQAAEKATHTLDKPSVDAGLIGLYVGDPLSAILPEYSANATLGLKQLIYAGGKINYAKKTASKAVEISELQNQLTTDEVLLKTETAYWTIVNLNEKVILSKKYISLLQALEKDLNNSFTAGLIYKNDVLRVQVQLNTAQLDLKKAEDGLVISKLTLAQIMGTQNTDFTITGNFSDNYILPFEEDGRLKSENRAETALLKNAVEIDQLQTKILEADRKPTVALSASGLYSAGKAINFSNGKDDLTSFYGLVNISVPVFDWGGRKQKVKEQEFKTEARKTDLKEASELIAIEVQDTYLQLAQAKEQVELSKESLISSEENLRLNNDRFDAGTVVGKDVLEAQVLWQHAYSNTIDAKARYKISEARYKKAINDLN